MLTLALVRRQFQRAAIRQVIGFVAIEHRLDVIVAAGNRRQARSRPAERLVIEHSLSAGRESIHVEPEQVGACERFIGLDMRARFARHVAAQQQNDPSVDRRAVLRGRKAD